jgi:glycosyltransferase involved in cell wall biosynthesis
MSSWPREVALVIVGDGAERPKVEEAVRIHHPRVVYLGKQPYRAMPGIIARSLAALSVKSGTTRHADMGTFPLKLFEAMACGVPVVVSDLPGMAHLIRESGSGLIVPPGDPQALAEAVRRLFYEAEERRRMGIRGRELVEKAHSWDHRAAETQRLLLRLLEGKAKGQ